MREAPSTPNALETVQSSIGNSGLLHRSKPFDEETIEEMATTPEAVRSSGTPPLLEPLLGSAPGTDTQTTVGGDEFWTKLMNRDGIAAGLHQQEETTPMNTEQLDQVPPALAVEVEEPLLEAFEVEEPLVEAPGVEEPLVEAVVELPEDPEPVPEPVAPAVQVPQQQEGEDEAEKKKQAQLERKRENSRAWHAKWESKGVLKKPKTAAAAAEVSEPAVVAPRSAASFSSLMEARDFFYQRLDFPFQHGAIKNERRQAATKAWMESHLRSEVVAARAGVQK